MWEQLAAPDEFVRQLKRKLGVADTHWSLAMRAERYTAQSIE